MHTRIIFKVTVHEHRRVIYKTSSNTIASRKKGGEKSDYLKRHKFHLEEEKKGERGKIRTM